MEKLAKEKGGTMIRKLFGAFIGAVLSAMLFRAIDDAVEYIKKKKEKGNAK